MFEIPPLALVILAFVTRTTALVALGMLFVQFRGARGSFARYFTHAFAALCFLLVWVWIASVAELVAFMKGASAAVEFGANYIFIPNLVITIWVGRLAFKFRSDEPGKESYGDQP